MQKGPTSPERLLVYTAIAILGFLLVWFELNLLLLAFAGVLVAVLLEAVTSWIVAHTRLNGTLAYLTTIILIALFFSGIAFLVVPRAGQQIVELTQSLPNSIRQLETQLQESSWGDELLKRVQTGMAANSGAHMRQVAALVTDTITDVVVIAVVGFFTALNPHGYKEGILALFPERNRNRVRQVSEDLQHQLKWWMLGQTVPMIAIGLASGLALRLLDVPLPWTLGVLTAFAVFLPYAGTIIAGVLSVLMALQRSPHTALWVLVLYTLLHLAEGYVLTPLAQRKAVHLPPVLTILVQYFMWSVGGILGLALAAPLAGAGIVLVKEVFLHVAPDEDVVARHS